MRLHSLFPNLHHAFVSCLLFRVEQQICRRPAWQPFLQFSDILPCPVHFRPLPYSIYYFISNAGESPEAGKKFLSRVLSVL